MQQASKSRLNYAKSVLRMNRKEKTNNAEVIREVNMQAVVFLAVLVFSGPGNGSYVRYYKMPDMKTCYESVKNSKTVMASGGDSEGAISLYCVNSKNEKGD